VRHQRAADEDHLGQAVPQAEFADGVGQVDVGCRADGSVLAALRDGQAEAFQFAANFGGACRVARCQQGEQARMPRFERAMA
jgi:hypothetical protein